MLMLTKSVLAMMIGFLLSALAGLILIPLLKKLKAGQRLSIYMQERHAKKAGTPTMGGLIFIIPTLLTTLILFLLGKMEFSTNLVIVVFVMLAYAIVGFIDDYLIIKRHDNKGLTEVQKLFGQILIAVIFFYLYMKSGAEPLLWIEALGIKQNIGWLYGILVLFFLVGFSNAVNITDGLDGLAGGLSVISFIVLGLVSWATSWLAGYEDIALFCFILVGSLMGFLIFNTNPAKVFMGDTGSLALGGVMATVAILTRHEVLLVVIAGVFVIDTLTVILQVIWLRLFHKRLFLMTPLHHHFEKLGWDERDIVKLFWVIGLILAMAAITYGVWI